MSHNHYFRDVSGLERIDVYRLLDLFGVTCPVAQHVVKKAIAASQRGHKTTRRDWQDIADSAARKLEMIDEDNGWTDSAIKAAAFPQQWPDETRRQDAAAEDEAFAAVASKGAEKSGIPNFAVGADVAFPTERGLYFAQVKEPAE